MVFSVSPRLRGECSLAASMPQQGVFSTDLAPTMPVWHRRPRRWALLVVEERLFI